MAAQDATRVDAIRHLLERFPEDETTVRDLIHAGPDLRHAVLPGVPPDREELLTRIGGYMPA